MSNIYLLLFSVFYFITINIYSSRGTQIIIVNNCKDQIWPGILGTTGHETPNDGGFPLKTNQQLIIQPPNNWSGRIWARQGCTFDQTETSSCQTGDCNGQLKCMGIGGQPPATLVEMTLGTNSSPVHYYDVSLIDGFNLPVSMIPVGGGVGCGVAACEADLNSYCPQNLVVRRGGEVVGCKSVCLASRDDKYCCTGEYTNPKTCKPTLFGNLFKSICPRAYAYAYDEASGLKTCRAKRYLITFCPN